MRESLEQDHDGKNIANGDLLDLMRRAKCFGINLASDWTSRQESSGHSETISEFVKKNINP